MVHGGTAVEHIQFNEDTLWAGQPHDYSHPGASNFLAEIRQMIFEGHGAQMYKKVAQSNFMSLPIRQTGYQPCGDLYLRFGHEEVTNYHRWLDLDTATAGVSYETGGVTYTREVFASYPDGVIVVKLAASQPGKLTFTCDLDSAHTNHTVQLIEGGDLLMQGTVSTRTFMNDLESKLKFASRLHLTLEGGGKMVATNGTIRVSEAKTVTIILSASTSFVNYHDISGDPPALCEQVIKLASGRGVAELEHRHLEDYQKLFRRVSMELGSSDTEKLPADYRISHLGEAEDPQLVSLFFQMGRYLIITGSRPGSQPLNLQGKWNNKTDPPWESKWTVNINTEMNYWSAEEANLAECHLPLFDLINDLAGPGHITAREHYNCDGWVVHHNTDLWRGTAPINGADGIWPMGGAWLCQHIWWHYEFSGDREFLKREYPVMKGAAEFFTGYLIPDPRRPATNTWMITNPSFSPEHGDDCAGATMDNQILRDLFGNVIAASEILGVDADFRSKLKTLRAQLPPNQIGRFGQLQEWIEDIDKPKDAHRHMSPLFGLFPGNEITPYGTPELFQAARVLIENRGDPVNNNGWSKAWKMCLRDRLHEGEQSHLIVTNIINHDAQGNLMFMRSNTQMDGTFGATAGIAEMFLQSQAGEIALLPALPSAWPKGYVKGLRARGGFEVGMEWNGGKLTRATLESMLGTKCRLRTGIPVRIENKGKEIHCTEVSPGLMEFATEKGEVYDLVAK
jgi:alpha-L-fucosidase 2